MKVKNLHNTTDSELIELTKENTDIITESDDIGVFVAQYNIQRGKNIVSIRLLYRLYRFWSNKAVNLRTFTNQITMYVIRHKREPCVFISLNNLNVTKETAKYLVEKESIAVPYTNNNIMQDFFCHYAIEEGNVWVSGKYLYDLFIHYMKHVKPSKISRIRSRIYGYFKLALPYKLTAMYMFRINEVSYELLQAEYNRKQAFFKKQAKKNKTCRPKTKRKLENPLQ